MGLDPDEAEDHVCAEGAPAWLATMGDLMSLLLVFFVLMLSFANMDKQLFMEAMGSIQQALGVIQENPGKFKLESSSMIQWNEKKSTPFLDILEMDTSKEAPTMDQRIMQQVQQAIAENNLSRIVEAESSERGVIVRVKGGALFKPGSDQLLPISFVFLDEVVRITEEFPYELSIEGHTDDAPISTPRFPTNWHLSAARSIAVLRYMIDAGDVDPSRIAAAGYGSTRPLVPNDSEENRATNRRVEFVYKRDPIADRSTRAERRARDRDDDAG
ncbi:MAG: OmpA family protein [Myxococcota bacterium]|nr:OmpA family protein [Myxococcales bacterium]